MIIEVDLFDRMPGKSLVVSGLGLKVFLGILLLIMETIGNYLLFCMVWYEKFGMDSKKRTITNQLLSRMIVPQIVFNIFFMPLHFGALFIPFSEYFQDFSLLYVSFFKKICSLLFFGCRWIYISHCRMWFLSYNHACFANTGRNGDCQDSVHLQIFYHCCNGWIFPYKFHNII